LAERGWRTGLGWRRGDECRKGGGKELIKEKAWRSGSEGGERLGWV
jgi:hypothetical protein